MGVRVGTSGWSYADWHGPVYPKGLKAGERLSFYATLLRTTEVNSTFYRDPPPAMVRGWVRKTAGLSEFELSVKTPKALTQEALAKGTPGECAKLAKGWAALIAEPLAEADRLGALFLQLSPGIFPNRPTLDRLDATLAVLDSYPVAVELRNKTWHDETKLLPEAVELLDAHGAAPVIVDGPSFPSLFEGKASHAYVRFHGRNHDVWHKRRGPERDPEDPRMNRYDYLYDEKELRPWADRLADLARKKPVVRAYFNNHPEGQAVENAFLFERLLARRDAPLDRAVSTQRRLPG